MRNLLRVHGPILTLIARLVFLSVSLHGCSPSAAKGSDSTGSAQADASSSTSNSTATDVSSASAGAAAASSGEGQAANQPQAVSGAYLSSCANIGYLGVGCNIVNATTKAQASELAGSIQITVHYSDNSSSAPTLQASPSGQWLVHFPVLANKLSQITSIEIGVTVAGAKQALPSVVGGIGLAPVTVAAVPKGGNVVFVTKEVYQPGTANFTDWGMIADSCSTLGAASKVIPNAAALNWTGLMSLEASGPDGAGDTSPNIADYLGTTSGPVVNTAGQIVAASMPLFWGPHLGDDRYRREWCLCRRRRASVDRQHGGGQIDPRRDLQQLDVDHR